MNKGRICSQQAKKLPNKRRAITEAKIATICNGKRIVRKYDAGEELIGMIQDNDAPPYTGYVRGWFRKKTGGGNAA